MKYYRLKDDKVYLNFNICPYGAGKTYYEMNKTWKDLKKRIKQILDEEQSCREDKIRLIISLLELYKATYLKSKGEQDEDNSTSK